MVNHREDAHELRQVYVGRAYYAEAHHNPPRAYHAEDCGGKCAPVEYPHLRAAYEEHGHIQREAVLRGREERQAEEYQEHVARRARVAVAAEQEHKRGSYRHRQQCARIELHGQSGRGHLHHGEQPDVEPCERAQHVEDLAQQHHQQCARGHTGYGCGKIGQRG